MLQKLKDVAVIFDTSAAGQRVLEIAAQLAGAHDARLVGISMIKGESEATPPCEVAPGHASSDVLRPREVSIEQHSKRAVESMARVSVNHGVRALYCGVNDAESLEDMDLQVSNSDLLVVAHRDAPSTPIFWSADRALHHTGGPILIVPETWNGSDVGRRIVVAWNGSRPARRAVLDALPLLSAAQAVSLLIVDSDELAIPDPETDVVAYLKRHGIRSEIQKVKSHGLSVAEVIAAHARKRGADLIVFGASSRHHGSDAVLGCATRSLLSSVPLPLFVSR